MKTKLLMMLIVLAVFLVAANDSVAQNGLTCPFPGGINILNCNQCLAQSFTTTEPYESWGECPKPLLGRIRYTWTEIWKHEIACHAIAAGQCGQSVRCTQTGFVVSSSPGPLSNEIGIETATFVSRSEYQQEWYCWRRGEPGMPDILNRPPYDH